MRFHSLYGAIALIGLAHVQSLQADSIYQLVVFGDSLSDNGNAAAALASAGKTLGNYAANAFTDGPQTLPAAIGPQGLWIDHLAALLSLPDPQPFVVSTTFGSSGGMLSANASGTNFAVASALAGNNANFSPTNYLNPANLYVFWAGANNLFQSFGSVSSFVKFPEIAKNAADSVAADIATLASAGGKHFLWMNLPPLGHVPYVNDNSDIFVRALGPAAADGAALVFNDELARQVNGLQTKYGIDIAVVNTNSLFSAITANPSKYGFVDVRDAGWCGTDGVKACTRDNPHTFLFWDELHPTTAAHQVLAQFTYSYVASRF